VKENDQGIQAGWFDFAFCGIELHAFNREPSLILLDGIDYGAFVKSLFEPRTVCLQINFRLLGINHFRVRWLVFGVGDRNGKGFTQSKILDRIIRVEKTIDHRGCRAISVNLYFGRATMDQRENPKKDQDLEEIFNG
jgi:hypothetical protein